MLTHDAAQINTLLIQIFPSTERIQIIVFVCDSKGMTQ